jgi:hypothetical protein
MPEGPRPAQRCEELECGRGFECLHVRRNDRRRAMCVRMRRNEMCRPAPTRPDDDRERPTGDPDRERPTGRPDRPTGRPDRPTGRDMEKRSVKSHPRHRDDRKEDSQSDDSRSDSASMSVTDDSTVPDEVNQDGKSKSSSTGRDRGKSKDLDSSGDSEEGSGEDDTKGKMKLKGRDKTVSEQLDDDDGEIVVELDQHGKLKDLVDPIEEVEVDLDENGNLKKKPEDEATDEEEEEKSDSQVERDENEELKKSDELASGEEEETTGKLKTMNEEVDVEDELDEKKEDDNHEDDRDEGHEDGRDEKKEEELLLERNARQASDRIPLIDILTAVRPPDLCMERRCCDGESCFVRRMAENIPPLAFCAPVSFFRYYQKWIGRIIIGSCTLLAKAFALVSIFIVTSFL